MTVRADSTDDSADRRLIARIAQQDRTAFEQFYGNYARRVLAFVRDIVGSREIAEEVTSDAMIAVWTSAKRYRGGSRVLTWVFGIAHHKALDAVRRVASRQLALQALPIFATDTIDPVDELLLLEDRLMLDLALRALSADHRTVLQLMYGFGCSQAEIAEIVDCPVATVKTRVFHAKRRLRDELARAAAGEPA